MSQETKKTIIVISSVTVVMCFALICGNHFSDRLEIEINNKTTKNIIINIIENEQATGGYSLGSSKRKILTDLRGSGKTYYVKITDESNQPLCLVEINNDIYKSLKRDFLTHKKHPFPIIIRE